MEPEIVSLLQFVIFYCYGNQFDTEVYKIMVAIQEIKSQTGIRVMILIMISNPVEVINRGLYHI